MRYKHAWYLVYHLWCIRNIVMIDITKGIEPILVISGSKFTILRINFYIINEISVLNTISPLKNDQLFYFDFFHNRITNINLLCSNLRSQYLWNKWTNIICGSWYHWIARNAFLILEAFIKNASCKTYPLSNITYLKHFYN